MYYSFTNRHPISFPLVQLTSLDMEVVSEESKSFANTVFLKKSMYYNMRSRILKRHAGHVIRKVRCSGRVLAIGMDAVLLVGEGGPKDCVEKRRMTRGGSALAYTALCISPPTHRDGRYEDTTHRHQTQGRRTAVPSRYS